MQRVLQRYSEIVGADLACCWEMRRDLADQGVLVEEEMLPAIRLNPAERVRDHSLEQTDQVDWQAPVGAQRVPEEEILVVKALPGLSRKAEVQGNRGQDQHSLEGSSDQGRLSPPVQVRNWEKKAVVDHLAVPVWEHYSDLPEAGEGMMVG